MLHVMFCMTAHAIIRMGLFKLTPFLSVPPSFQVMPQGMNVTVGSPLILHCKAMGSPNPNITWQKDGLSVDTTHVTLLSNGSLYISSTVVLDAGRYSCKATNVAGSRSVRANIVIYG